MNSADVSFGSSRLDFFVPVRRHPISFVIIIIFGMIVVAVVEAQGFLGIWVFGGYWRVLGGNWGHGFAFNVIIQISIFP